MNLLNIEIVSVKGVIFKDNAFLAVIPSIEGEIGFMRNHQSAVVKLQTGKILILDEKQNIIKEIEVENGIAEMIDGEKLSVIVE